eukprot:10824163-Heterocapsa_arctica.AAC.1
MDKRLAKDRQEYVGFIRDLHARGIVYFCRHAHERATVLFVRKKNGRLRMVLDCRLSNRRFRDTPP